MNQMRILMDPTGENSPAKRERPNRPSSLQGLTVGLLDISKARGDKFLDRLESILQSQGAATKRYRKPTFARIASTPLKQQIASECHVVVEALAD